MKRGECIKTLNVVNSHVALVSLLHLLKNIYTKYTKYECIYIFTRERKYI